MNHLIDSITHLIGTLGYPGVLLLMALESACIPIPSEAIMPFAGSLIITDPARHFNLHTLAFVGALGNLLGSIVAYWVGAVGGRPFLEKYGKYVLIKKRDIDKSDHYFQKYGEATVLFTRVMPIVRTFISLPAGIAKMNFSKFCVFTFLGALPFCYLLAWLGIKFGQHMEQVKAAMHKADFAVAAVLIVLFAVWLKHHLKPDAEDESSDPQSRPDPAKAS